MSDLVNDLCDIAAKAVELAKKHGADDAEVVVRDGAELTAKVRLGQPELVQEAGSRALGLRIFKDLRSAVTYTSDLRAEPLDAFIAESVTLAELSEPDEFNRLPDAADLAKEVPALDLWDESCLSIDAAEALRRCQRGEKAALDFDPRVGNSDGASFSRVLGASAFASSGGFVGGYRGTYASFYVEPLCDDADNKKRNGYWWTAGRFLDTLADPEEVGREAARRTVATLGSRKIETCEVPVIFDPEVGRSIVGTVFSVSNGSSMYRKSTYLLDREGTPIASPLVTIVDDPLIPRAPGSRAFDGDGLPTRRNVVVERGVLETVLCDTYSARKLGRASTGSAGRGVGGTPGPTTSNLIMQPGETDRDALIAKTERGLYVTSMMGFGFNPITGDFSRGAQGFWIENGELGFPVSEITVSCNFDDLLQRIDHVCSDLDQRASTACPTFRVSRMTIAGR
ncbi:TldD/PmbA family protein [Haliangium ochraceum]|uniref:Peptidase U62 modulator of DNA gyrase n=1 Tax=Haliangium ochraceum (strain DSM 14365 / JCM 11303 / SMP-2) TaxID=502025 RepID=D0LV04_HALO1|nr:TldD/PmbA family protein [Haliangium ochraceum]ACY15845.1 peptidase U62 modulator of DNA gyrase [Haliangium ochraceum DSM 14365]